MKKCAALVLALMLLIPVLAQAEEPVLLMQMPDDVQMVENVAFDDGDFIQTYQLSGGANVHLLRYADFGMTIDDLIASEWSGAQNVSELGIASVGGCPAQSAAFSCPQDGAATVDVTMVLVDYGAGTLVFEAIVPQGSADAQAVKTMISTMNVFSSEEAQASEAEVG